jgi:molybdopterin/thiamine biosynthesis adenylyltransferase
MTDSLPYSRPQATADQLADVAEDHHRFTQKSLLLTGEPEILATANGRMCLLDSLRLLIRICPNVTVSLPPGFDALLNECRGLADQIAFGAEVIFTTKRPDFTVYDTILSVGVTANRELPWIVINSNGWVARVSSGQTDLPGDCDQSNPVGALAAASLGTAEVFKRLIKLKPDRGRFFDGLSFSLHSYQTGSDDTGPSIPTTLLLQMLIVGVGAIGNGVVHLLSQLPLTGQVWIIDGQAFGKENLGTSILIGPSDISKGKATFAAQVLGHRIQAQGFLEKFDIFSKRLGTEVPYPKIVINALDNIDARHEVQRNLWADLIIDGAIGDFGCQVSCHPWAGDVACLMCLFRKPPGESAEQAASRATGLTVERASQMSGLVSEVDVQGAPVHKREWLRAQVGQPICSVIQEAIAQQLSEEKQREGFAPSVAFVACLSACMVVSELVKYITGQPTIEPRFQFDVLRGPAGGQYFPQERRKDCMCVTRRNNIEIWRQRRS